ncbi:hypothetical protein [Elizabethkingia anophelis]|uniref:hypothetical protein n=1 Tax=Elizabethkingia anophelis TaxID=1117645 RepID=UPI0004E3F6BC|nr:hypothetical protein [Elizabethkingia anophelis]KFC34505.1 hypothetical protein FF18_07425 [Elizabethkingia anophelis]MCL1033501.1 hypothetical protein [Elizabethkingia anophelis]MCT3697870.1 hypothetical protein [Elizabethkingia anophelis]MCT3786040.1 hypothetical protein [Elizabethkingia anophelis]MCT4121734.1 hypothetical protein [Elizabethkingia anophelis]
MKNGHHFLILTGIFSIIAGLYTFIIPSGYYPVFTPVIDLAFFTLGLSGIIFSSHRFKILDHIIWYCIYSSIIFIFSISISNHTVEMRLFLIGAICLYQYMWQLYHGLFFRKQKYPASIIIFISISGIIFSGIFIYNIMHNKYSSLILTALSFISLGISFICLASGLKKYEEYQK